MSRTGDTRGQDPVVAVCRDVSPTITQNYGKQVDSSDTALGPNVICMSHGQANAEITAGYAPTLNCNHEQPIALVGNTIGRQPHNGGNGTGFDESGAMYTLTKTDVHAVAFRTNAAGQVTAQDGISAALNTQTDPCAQIVAFAQDVAQPLRSNSFNNSDPMMEAKMHIMQNMQVRRLTPRECERLQAFPDDYTNIPGASDTTRYKALGNSMAVNVMQLIGERIRYVEGVL